MRFWFDRRRAPAVYAGSAARGSWSASRTHATAPMVACALLVAFALACTLAWAPPAHALATVGAPPQPGPSGLPNGRVYEQVSPAYKNGNFYDALSEFSFGLAAGSGDAVVYPMSGAVGTAYAGAITEYVSTRTPGLGWQTVSTTPRPDSADFSPDTGANAMIPAAAFDRFLFTSPLADVAAEPKQEQGIQPTSGVNIFVSEDPAIEPVWIGEPRISEPTPATGDVPAGNYIVAGASPELETVYFTFAGTLTPEDLTPAGESRAENVALGPERLDDPWGFYEWSGGGLVSAGVLPDGRLSPFGAVPAAIAPEESAYRTGHYTQADGIDNEVSADGSRAFFVSPDPEASSVTDPASCATEPPCTGEAPQLYVRESAPGGGKVSVLVSASQLAGHEGEPAPHGATSFADTPAELVQNGGTYAFASPDGSQVFFASTDRLTQEAPENGEAKMYDYDTETGVLTYMHGVTGAIAVASSDGSELLFENRALSPWRLELWRSGSNGGSVTPVAKLVRIR